MFNADDEPDGATEDMVTYAGKVKRCLACESKVQIVEIKNE